MTRRLDSTHAAASAAAVVLSPGGRVGAVSRATRILLASTPALVRHVRTLFIEHAASLGFDLCFQGFDGELGALPGKCPVEGEALVLENVVTTWPAASACRG